MTHLPETHELVCLDGEVIHAGDARVSAISSLALAGKGVFTTAAFFSKEIFQQDRHLTRLLGHARAVGVDIAGIDGRELTKMAGSLIDRCDVPDGKVRISIFDTAPTRLWRYSGSEGASVLVQTGALPARSAAKAGVSPYPINSQSPLAGIKSCNYLEQMIAAEDSQARGFGECLRVNEAEAVVSGCLSNLFWRSAGDGGWKTPALSTGCLEGTTRAYVMGSVEVEETETGLQELLRDATSLFFTSSAKGILPADSLEGAGPLQAPGDEVLRLFDRYPVG